jgi:hypothetical protein
VDYESRAKDLQQVVKAKKTELLFLALFLRPLLGCPCQEVHPVSRVDKKSNARSRVSFPALNFRGPESNCRPAEVQQLKVCLS